ncbi:Asp23/Gls24 family envelope stress response protein [Granulicatella seriolae]|uniref:Asp23/Gls24 family envelope stress response protein n=1 Tax=Granulicatella seriolae TaxID=2967226 RepID=A0ABT1WNJ2_9LACT|nr:Asp23/Gls24 family envelope stress response protein [Granulicatella seriolae]
MTVKIQTDNGMIELSNEVIATVVGGAATDNYGVVGMASRNQIRDNLNDILKRENFSRGVVVRQENQGIAVDVYIVVGYGTKISAICRNVQEQVKYNLESMLGFSANTVNVYVQGVKVIGA